MSLVYFLLLVGVLVAVHELGHFLAARALGIGVLRFSLGFGPPLLAARVGGTEYRFSAVPLGGYVRLLGEDPGEDVPAAQRHLAFSTRPLWQRLCVVFAGPAANLLFPLVIYFFFFLGHTEVPAAVVGDILPDSPAAAAGLQPGDRVLRVGGHDVHTWEDLEDAIGDHEGRGVRLDVLRSDEARSIYVTPRRQLVRHASGESEARGMIGVLRAPLPPRVGVVDPASPAGRAGLRTGDLVISVDGEPVTSWTVFAQRLERHKRRVPLAYLRAESAPLGCASVRTLSAALADVVPSFDVDEQGRARVDSGIASAEFFVAHVAPGSPAARAGLARGDLVLGLDGAPVTSWMRLVQALWAEPGKTHELRVQRARPGGGSDILTLHLEVERQQVRDEFGQASRQLVFGASNDDRPGEPAMVAIDGRVGYAIDHAFSQTSTTIAEVGGGFADLLVGRGLENGVGGPIMMYQIASVSGAKGWDYFLLMLALISVNLGLLNLLPIPVLDGGHVLLFAVERAIGRKLSPEVRDMAVLGGLVLLVVMAIIALRNDILNYVLR